MVNTLAASIRNYKWPTIATPILVLFEVACEMAIPFVTANLIDVIKDGATVAEILPTAGVLVVIALISLLFGAAAGITCSYASCGFAKNLRHDLFYKIQTFSFANIDRFSSSSLVTRLTTDVTNVQQAFMLIICIAVRAPLVLVFAFAMAYAMGGSISFVYLAMIPLLGGGLGFIIHKVGPIFTRVFHKYDALNESVEENVTGMRVVKSYVREDYEKQKFAHAAQDVCADFTRAEKLLAFNNPMMNLCVNGAFVLIIFLGSKLIITSQGELFDVGQLSSTFTYGFQILMSLMQLSMIFVMVTMAEESANRIVEVLHDEPTIANPNEPIYEVADGSIDFDDASKTENTRVSYPIYHIDNIVKPVSKAGHATKVIFLTADAFGVLPPVSRLTASQTQYHFLSGFTAKLAGTERGVTEPTPTFSACFGAAFLSLHPTQYAEVLVKRMQASGAQAYLVNTGWNGTGKRISIKDTRAIIDAILDGSLDDAETFTLPMFDLAIPTSLPGVDTHILDPRNTYGSPEQWREKAESLAKLFIENFEKYTDTPAGAALVSAGPKL